ncbi:MAG: DUF1559 domain-containing protein [Planctomycetia bacterium]|nr:DUF1559 domain-containing protein [Planctomycetia bacterium]MDO5114075.1 DUF1559 domain-containing protein [Planctomycetia bacterium]
MNKKNAFTLVELLVVIAIIGVLMGLLLPAVQMAREAARNSTCMNNLRQIGIAMHSYHALNEKFPWGGYCHPNVYIDGVRMDGKHARGFAWSVYILPQLEQSALYEQLDFNTMYSMGDNDTLAQTELPIFVCPSALNLKPQQSIVYCAAGTAIRPKPATYGLSHYGGIYGERIAFEGRTLPLPNDPPRGTMLYTKQIADSDIYDGTSQTLLIGEDTHWADGQWISSYNVMDQCAGINDPSVTENEIRSDHVGGANVVFADSHVQMLTSSLSLEVLAALCTRASGEVIPSGNGL